jgi:hypothetical protein
MRLSGWSASWSAADSVSTRFISSTTDSRGSRSASQISSYPVSTQAPSCWLKYTGSWVRITSNRGCGSRNSSGLRRSYSRELDECTMDDDMDRS